MEDSFGEYVKGGLGSVEASGFPLTLRDLKLNEKKIQEDLEEDGSGMPFDLTSGKIGSISVTPGWRGVEITATNIVLNLSFSAVKAMAWMMKREDPDEADETAECEEVLAHLPPPPAPVAPRYCSSHSTSEMRVKTEPRFEECQNCHLRLQTNYSDFAYCPPCSEKLERCMLCGSSAPTAGSYVPAQHLQPAAGVGGEFHAPGLVPPALPPPPRPAARFCQAHDASEKRTKADPKQMECTECHMAMQTNYLEFTLCPACSDRKEQCMICGAAAPACSSSAPPPAPPAPPPRVGEARLDLEPPGAADAAPCVDPPDQVAAARADPEDQEVSPPTDSQRPLPRGGWREGSRPVEKRLQASQIGCGLPCAVSGPGGDGVLGFFRIFDFGSWSQCNANCNGGAGGVRREPAEESPKVGARGGA
mmetsp:Transcript_59122/g.183366  ORF Transcript_59122/g.183366 Transcript_59122/m.183366 type:complete len:419 (+) Transcript_59122:1-1257(+)